MTGMSLGGGAREIVGALERGNPDLAAAARVRAAWNRIAGSRVRPHVTGVFVVPHTGAGELVVYTDTPIWASELGMQTELMRLKLNMELARMDGGVRAGGDGGSEQVRKLRFVASKEKYLSKERAESTHEQLSEEEDALAEVEPVPLSAEEDSALRSAAGKVGDARLRDAAYNAARASLEWQRGLDEAGLS